MLRSVTSAASLPRAKPAQARQPAREGRRPAGEFPLPPAARPGREEEGEGAGAGAGKAPARPPPSLVRQGRSGAGGGASGRRGPESPCHGAREAVAAGSAPRRASEEAGGGGEGGGGRPALRRLLCFRPLPGPAPTPLLSHRGGGGGRGRSGARAARGSPGTGLGRRLWTRMSRHEGERRGVPRPLPAAAAEPGPAALGADHHHGAAGSGARGPAAEGRSGPVGRAALCSVIAGEAGTARSPRGLRRAGLGLQVRSAGGPSLPAPPPEGRTERGAAPPAGPSAVGGRWRGAALPTCRPPPLRVRPGSAPQGPPGTREAGPGAEVCRRPAWP